MNDFFNDMRFNGINEEDAEFIPLLSQEDEDQMNNEKLPEADIGPKHHKR